MANVSAVKHRGPAQKRVLDEQVILLRQVNFKKLGANLVESLRKTQLRAGEPEGDMPWFLDEYIAAEQPRDYQMSVAIMNATKGFAIARTDTGEILAQFGINDLPRAEKIANTAKAEVAVNVMVNEAAAEEEAEDAE